VATSVDATATLQRSIAALEKAGGDVDVQLSLCASWALLANEDAELDRSPSESVRRARDRCAAAFAAAPSADAAANIAVLDSIETDWNLDHDGDPSGAVADGRRWLARSLELDPHSSQALFMLGRLENSAALWEENQGRSPQASFAHARAAFQSALRIDPQSANVLSAFAGHYHYVAHWKLEAHLNPGADIAAGVKLAEQALVIDPKLADGHFYLGALEWSAAKSSVGAARQASRARARSELERARALDRNLAHQVDPILKEIGPQ
jgi:hypothetical protein